VACENLNLESITSYVNDISVFWGPNIIKQKKMKIKEIKAELENTLKNVNKMTTNDAGFSADKIYFESKKNLDELQNETNRKIVNLNRWIAYAIFDYAKKRTGFRQGRKEKKAIADFYAGFGLIYTWVSISAEDENGARLQRKEREGYSLQMMVFSPIENERKIAQYILSNPGRSVKELLTGELEVYTAIRGN
jgi:hypothetical protein